MPINPSTTFNPLVKDKKNNLCLDISSYSISYGEDFNIPGYKHVIACGENKYFGEIKKQIELYVAISDDATIVELEEDSFTYTGNIINPAVNVCVNDKRINLWYETYLTYQIEYDPNCIDVGYYQLSVTSNNELGGCVIKQFEIVLANVNSSNIIIDYDEYVYGNGELIWPSINVSYNNNELSQNVDYIISNTAPYENIIPGDASITLLGKGNFTGDICLEYDINGDMKDCRLSCLLSDSVAYTGTEIKYQKNDFKLTWFNIDLPSIYDIRYITDNYIYPGEKRLAIYMSDEHWYNELLYTYSIVADIETDCTFEGYDSLYYSKGEEIKPNIVVKLINSSYILSAGVDYSVEYDPNVDYSTAGTKTIVIRGINESGYINLKTISYSVYDDSSTIVYYNTLDYPTVYNGLTHLTRQSIGIYADPNTITGFKAGSAISTIDFEIFKGCSNLIYADFSKCSAEIPEGAFENCNNLTYIFFENDTSYINDIYEIHFDSCEGELLGNTIYHLLTDSSNIKLPIAVNLNEHLAFLHWYTKDNIIINNISDIKSHMYDNKSITLSAQYSEDTMFLYLCFTAVEPNSTITITSSSINSPHISLIYYTSNNNTWRTFIVNKTVINLPNIGDKVYFRADNDNEGFTRVYKNLCHYNKFVMTGKIAASGNINSLLKSDGSIIDLTGRDNCYYRIFYNCSSLTQTPELPATTLASSCYSNMFNGCTSLTQAPELPATTLASSCYSNMFNGCTKLNNINVNFSAWNPTNATNSWVTNVSSTGTFTCPDNLLEKIGTSNIPNNWTIVRK